MIKQTEVDGVPALLAPATGQAGAGLAFRVGFADEPLARRGITHLVEHLALHSTGGADYHYNGATGLQFTFFHMQGSEEELATFLTEVCASLRELPMHRLQVEKDLLRTEANGRSVGPADQMPMWRHGARGYGLSSYPEWGLPAVTEDELRAWAGRFFTRENAVLWVAGGGVPAGLRLDLPGGTRQAAPAPTSALPVTPAWFPGSSGAVAWDASVPRAARSLVFAGVLERAMFRELRQEGGLSYAVHAGYDALGADHALVTAVADALPEKQGAVLGGFVDVLNALRVGRVDEADVAAVLKKQAEAIRHSEERGGRLPGQALNLLVGREVLSVEDALAEMRAVGAADVAEVAAAAYETGLLMTPCTDGAWTGLTAAPDRSAGSVSGIGYRLLDDPAGRLTIGPEGVSLASGDNLATVRFDECAIARAWADGGRHLVGHDGIGLWFEPTLLTDGAAARRQLDSLIPAAVRVDLPAREPGQIPQPGPGPEAASATASAEERGDRAMAFLKLLVLVPLTLIGAAVAVLLALAPTEGDADFAVTYGTAVVCAGLAALGAITTFRTLPRLRRRPGPSGR